MASDGRGISRRTLLVGGGAGVGLLVAYALWPRHYAPNWRAAPGEQLFNAFLKIGADGRVVVAVPQAEIGQGVYTSLPQIVADELGADWRTVSVEPAPISPLYANALLAEEMADGMIPSALQRIGSWAEQEYATRETLMLTGGSSSIRSFEPRLREAGAAARALLMQEAAERWKVDWATLDTVDGFVVNGKDKLRFGELAAEAAKRAVPEQLPMRGGTQNRLAGKPLPRLDLPAKIDGTAQFAGDIRLRDMVFASVRQGPVGDSRLVETDKAAAQKIAGVLAVFEMPTWAGAVATNWWAANRAVEAMKPVFATSGTMLDSGGIEGALAEALDEGEPNRRFERGDVEAALAGGPLFRSHYDVDVAPNAPLETLTATARMTGDRLEVWAPTQAPVFARAAAARAAGIDPSQVTLYRTFVGSGYGRKMETAAIEQAVAMAIQVKRPVQLVWSRIEETMQDTFRPPARATMVARMEHDGRVTAWHARIAAPSAEAQVIARLRGEADGGDGAEAVAGATPPYAIPAVAVDHVPVATGLRLGLWRSGAHSYTTFFTECFVDELARQAKMEPFSFRMQMLGDNPRLARVLSTASALGGWDGGGSGSNMGIAAYSAYGSHAAILVEAGIGKDQRIKVDRAFCVVDCGEVVNPDIVRQQIEGGIVYGISGATGRPISFEGGLASAHGFGDLGLPRLADTPDISVEIMRSEAEPGGVTELAVPIVAPAIANALFAATGQRLRSLPLVPGLRMIPPADHPPIPTPKIGVLLINLGTPNSPEPGSVKLYLKEFLSDPRVIEIPQLVWQPILRGVILNTRPKKSAHAYQQVWTDEGSPLAVITARQAKALEGAFGDDVIVDHAMRYGKPAIRERIEALKAAGCERILIAPLYPQYCAATTATANDEAFLHLRRMRWQPAVRTLPPYYDDPLYIDALKLSIEPAIQALPFAPQALIATFHGMPQRTLELGDPYHCHCRKTARLLGEAMGRELIVTFQSRFGRAKWLEPATDTTLADLPKRGITRIALAAPGFAADCLETLEEIAIRGRDTFLAAGGTDFAYLPCLNDSGPGMAMLRSLITRELEGWTSRP